MEHLINLSLFSLLSSPVGNNNSPEMLETAYKEFRNGILCLSQSGDDLFSFIRKLDFTRIEFITLQSSGLCGKEETCKKNLAYKSHPASGSGTEIGLYAG